MHNLTHAELALVFRVEDGLLIRTVSRGRAKAGDIAGKIDRQGYVGLQHAGHDLLAHRVIWLLTYGDWPAGCIDHINGVRSDNRLQNLRIATQSQNIANCKLRVDSRSGAKGVTQLRNGKWQAKITVSRVSHYLGSFSKKQDAIAAYASAAKNAFGAFANVGEPA